MSFDFGQDQREIRVLVRDLEGEVPGISEVYEKRIRLAEDSENQPFLGEFGEPRREHLELRRADTKPPLFDYQIDLIRKSKELCLSPAPANIGLLALPTGAGKTRTALCTVLDLIFAKKVRNVLWLAPTKELLEQASDTCWSLWHQYAESVDIDVIRSDLTGAFPTLSVPAIYLATPQLVSARLGGSIVWPNWDLLIFDEAHHVAAPTFKNAIEQSTQNGQVPVLGLSATPGRSHERETEALVEFFKGRLLVSQILTTSPVRFLQRRGVLARLSFKKISKMRELGAKKPLTNKSRYVETIQLVQKIPRSQKTLIFTGSVAAAYVLAAGMQCRSIASEVVSSYMSDESRENALKRFRTGEVSVLINKSILATGYDCPGVKHVVLTVPIRSATLFEQVVGRGSRGPAVGGNTKSIIWQFDDHLAMHGLPSSYYRFDDFNWTELRR